MRNELKRKRRKMIIIALIKQYRKIEGTELLGLILRNMDVSLRKISEYIRELYLEERISLDQGYYSIPGKAKKRKKGRKR